MSDSSWIMEARQKVQDALSAVFEGELAGRMRPYPPTTRVAPAMWIESHVGSIADGAATATFTVHGVVDGELEAQHALRDAMLARAVFACHAMPGLKPVRWRCAPITLEGTNPPETMRGFVLEVNATAATRTFCPPVVDSATVPTSEYVEV